MKEQSTHPTALKTSIDVDVMVAVNDLQSDLNSSREKLDWSPSSPTSCQESVDLSDADSDSSPVSVDSHVVRNTFNSPQHSDSDSEADYDSLNIHDLNQHDCELDSWTLVSPKSISSESRDGELVITQVPLKNRTPVVEDENDNDLREISRPPKKRQKTMLSMLSHSKKPLGAFNTINDSDTKSARRNNTKISFKETVDVICIPTRYEYSPEMRSQLWSSIHEINENAARNTIEFASEGWDWRNVTLDNDMRHCPSTGAYIHPIHFSSNQGHPYPNFSTAN